MDVKAEIRKHLGCPQLLLLSGDKMENWVKSWYRGSVVVGNRPALVSQTVTPHD